jgi:acetyl esterase/lipase
VCCLHGIGAWYGEDDLTHPLVSPINGDFKDFPKLLIQAGSVETLLSDSELIHQRALDHGVDSTLDVFEDCIHVFQLFKGIHPSVAVARQRLGEFVRAETRRASGVAESSN